jgi:hypothetical protein
MRERDGGKVNALSKGKDGKAGGKAKKKKKILGIF